MKTIDVLRATRRLLSGGLEGLDLETLTAIPPGFSNNILWHAGHLVVTQQLLCYGQAGLPLAVEDEMVKAFRKGTSPADWTSPPDPGPVLRLLVALPDQLAEDWAEGRFETFTPYTTKSGVELDSFEIMMAFNAYHEGVHTGQIMAFRRLVAR